MAAPQEIYVQSLRLPQASYVTLGIISLRSLGLLGLFKFGASSAF